MVDGAEQKTGFEAATHKGLPVAGYRPQREETVALVNENKAIEERVLRRMDALAAMPPGTLDPRWSAIARTQIEQGFMALNRALFQPERAGLPEDAPRVPRFIGADAVPPAA